MTLVGLLFASSLIVTSAPARGTVVSGPQNGVWDLAGSPYYVEGDVLVTTGLDIDPNVLVVFNGPYTIEAQAPLRADLVTFLGNASASCVAVACGAIRFTAASAGSVLTNSQLAQMAMGIIIEGAVPLIESNIIANTPIGMIINASDVPVMKVDIINSNIAYSIGAGAAPLIENGTVAGSFVSDFSVEGGSHPETLNTSFDGTVVIADGLSNLTVRNYLDVLVLDSGSPIPGADVFVREDGTDVYDSTAGDPQTAPDGMVRWIDTRDRVYVQGGVLPVLNEAEVAFSGLSFGFNPRSVDMSLSHRETFNVTYGPPQVNWTTPPDGAVGVPVNADIVVAFSEAMSAATTQGAFTYTDGPTTFGEGDGIFSWPVQDRFVFNPAVDLALCTSYSATIAGTATDLAGNPLDGDGDGTGGDPFTWSFMTESGPPVQVTLTDPFAGQTGVSITTTITISFSRPVDPGSVEWAFSYTDGARWWNQDNGTFQWDANGTRVTFIPDANLALSTPYDVRVNGTAEDLCGNTLDGNGNGASNGSPADDYLWSFTTEIADVEAPVVIAVTPEDSAVQVAPPTLIMVNFSENMNRSATEASLRITGGPADLNASDGDVSWAMGSRRMTLDLFSNLLYDTQYTVILNASLARDLAGNTLDGNGNGSSEGHPTDDYQWSFTTEPSPDRTPPEVVDHDPKAGEEGVAVGTDVRVFFSEDMDRLTAEAAFRLRGPNGTVAGQFTWSSDSILTFTPHADLDYLTEYTAEVGAGARDLAWNPLVDEYTWSFTTEPWTGTLTGRVVKEDGSPVKGVTVTLVEADRTATSGADGTYRILNVPAGTYNLTFSKGGFETLRTTVALELGQEEVQKNVTLRTAGGLADWWWVFFVFVLAFILAMLFLSQRKRGEEREVHLEEMEREVAVVELPTREESRPPGGEGQE
jgi:hypothetical protein